MALIKCKECGHMISEKALACPKCGCSVEKGNNLLEDKRNTNKNSSAPSKSVGKKKSTSDILWIVIPLFLIIVTIAVFVTIVVSEVSKSSDSDSSTTEASYGPGTYEFVDEAGKQWQLIIEIERKGSEEDYTYKEKKVCKLKNLSDGKEYEGLWNDHAGAIYRIGKYEGVSDDNFSVSILWDGYWGKMRDTPYPSSYIMFQKMPYYSSSASYYLEDGYMYWNLTDSKDINGNEFGFEEAFINRDPRIRLPIKKIK